MARSPFVPMEEKADQGAAGRGAGAGAGAAVNKEQEQVEQEVLLVHSQVRRIKKEEEEARERLLKLRLMETRPSSAGVTWRAPRSLSPLRRAGSAIIPLPVGE